MNLINLKNKNYSCSILADYGAALNSYQFNGKEFVQGYQNITETQTQKYKGVILAPFPNRIANAKFSFEGNDFELPINRPKEGLALHGFLYNQPFEILQHEEKFIVLQYNYTNTFSAFPFLFTLIVAYELLDSGELKIKTVVKNTGEKIMPFGVGWHPYFVIDDSIDTMCLKMLACDKMELKNNIPTEKLECFLTENKSLNLKEYHFDDCFVFNQPEIKFQLVGQKYQLNINAKSANNYPYFQIYTPKTRDSIAIEPMSCAPNAFNNKIGLLEIGVGQSYSFEYNILGKEI